MLLKAIDNTIKRKKMEDPVYYEEIQRTKSVLNCLKPRKGQKMQLPCDIKMKALRFLKNVHEK